LANYKLAALGKGTAQALLSIGAQPNFIGKGNDTEEIAHQFLDILSDKKVYFPISNRSLGKVHSVIPENQRVVEIAYTTESVKINLPENCEIVVFTSPKQCRIICSSCSSVITKTPCLYRKIYA
jgi:uroporphyrinogen-III synthase